jgi:hypothetical protein
VHRPGHRDSNGRDGPGGRRLPLHGTPLTPQACDGAAAHLRRYGPVQATRAPAASLFAEGVA